MSGPPKFSYVTAEAHIPNAEDTRAELRGRMNSGPSKTQDAFSRSRLRGRTEEKPFGLARRFSRSKSRSRRKAAEPKGQWGSLTSQRHARSISKLDKDLADLPSLEMVQLDCTNIQCSDSAIGVALGSPSQLQPMDPEQVAPSTSPTMQTKLLSPNDPRSENSTNKSKGARWKKMGDLFRAKNAISNEPAASPFYQMQTQHPAQIASPSDLSFGARSADFVAQEQKARHLFGKILGPNGQLDPQKSMQDPFYPTHPAGGRPGESALHFGYPPTRLIPEQTPSVVGLPLLDVKIPEVQMERYSVMFGSLLEKQQQPSSLLSRRDRELDRLRTISDTEQKPSEVVPVQEQQPETLETKSKNTDQSCLSHKPCPTYPRRATSPAPSKSPSFSLFPPLPLAPEKIVGPIPPGKQSPPQRSFTAPVRLSPTEEIFNLGEVRFPNSEGPMTDNKTVTTSPQTASTWDLKRDSSDPTYLSPISSHPSPTKDALLEIESLDPVTRSHDRPEVSVDEALQVAPLRPRHVNKDTESGTVQGQQVGTDVKNKDTVDVLNETLAALERPRLVGSKDRDIPGLQPSQTRIDRIMRDPSPNQRTKGPAEMKTEKDLPEASQSTAKKEALQESVDPLAQLGKVADNAGVSEGVASPPKAQTSAVTSSRHEIASLHDQVHSDSETISQPVQPSPRDLQLSPDNSSIAVNALKRQPPNTAIPSGKAHQNTVDFHARRPPPPRQTGRSRPAQPAIAQRQVPRVAGNAHQRTPPEAHDQPPVRPPLNGTNRSFPTYRAPPRNFVVPVQPPLTRAHPRFNQMHPPSNHTHPPSRPRPLPANTPLDQDNILDYYFENVEANPSPRQTKSSNKLQKQQPNTSKRFSFSGRPVPPSHPRSELTASQTSNMAPRSPVPISKYSANAAAILKSVVSPTNSGEKRHRRTLSDSSTFTKQIPGQQKPVSSARVADKKAGHTHRFPSVQNPSLPRSRSVSTISNSSHRAQRAKISFIVADPKTKTPSLGHTTPRPQSPSQDFGFTLAGRHGKTLTPKRFPGKGASLSSLSPPGAGNNGFVAGLGVEARSLTPKLVVSPPRSASAGTVGAGAANTAGIGATAAPGTAGIHGHLKPEKGEKVVERQAGLVPKIIDPERNHERGHRAEKSIDLIIESI